MIEPAKCNIGIGFLQAILDAENIKLGSTLSNDQLADKGRAVSEIELAPAA